MGMVPENVKRATVGALLSLGGFLFLTGNGFPCPLWQAGLPCPSCGMTRAMLHIACGEVGAAFASNLFFPYWLFLGGGIIGGLLGYALRLSDDPNSLGRSAFEATPFWIHASILLASGVANLLRFGVNPEGWIWRILPT
jgi:hypothetical protein